MSVEARALLDGLLDKIERQPDRVRRVQDRAPEAFGSADERTAFRALLEDAARAGAVELEYGRGETRHLLERVLLLDAPALYRFLGRTPASELAARAAAALRTGAPPGSSEALRALDEIATGWTAARSPFGFARDDLRRAMVFVSVLDAVCRRDPADRSDMRTFSKLKTGRSKNIEEMARPIAEFCRWAGLVDPKLDDDDVLKLMGLEKFPQPVLVSGPVQLRGADLSSLLYIGIAPEDAAALRPTGPIRSVLTVENFASFNRHVREARRVGDLVIFTGGFPSRAVVAALVAIAAFVDGPIHHWGDVDQGGIGIALHLCRKLPVPVVPHLMDADMARRRGAAGGPARLADGPIPEAWKPLVDFLQSEECRFLEQEELDPAAP